MIKTLKIVAFIISIFVISVPLLHAAAPLEDPFYAQLKEVQGTPPLQAVFEEVNPFNGYLRLVHTDVHLPGNGGLDLRLLRMYNSAIWGRRDGAGLNVFVADKNRSPLGIGWTLHMGIVRNPFGVGATVEMPDGSTHALYTVTPTTFISKEFWTYKVLANGVFELTLTDGTVYTFQFNTNAGYVDYNNVQVAQVTSIRNAANTAQVSIAYNKTIGNLQ